MDRILRFLAAWVVVMSCSPAIIAADAEPDRKTLTHAGDERSFVLRLPPGLPRDGSKVPLVLVLHGGGGNGLIAERMTGFSAKAAAEGFIVVYPDGSGRLREKLLTWNAGHCCGHAMRQNTDDVGFIAALIDRVSAEYPVDPARIYVTGMSNGGMMSHRIGRELSSRVAAIAPVVATVFGDESVPERPVSALMFNGVLDESVPAKGGPPGGPFADSWDGTPARPAGEQGTFWAKANACAAVAEERETEAIRFSRYTCPGGLGVELYLMKDMGHAWPGGLRGRRSADAPGTALNATEVIWEFFAAHPKAAR
jgi:polyhydroxybutyrate depolymerase